MTVRLDDRVPGTDNLDPIGALYLYLQIDGEPEQQIGVLAPDSDGARAPWHFKTMDDEYGWIASLRRNFYAGPEQFLEGVRAYLLQ